MSKLKASLTHFLCSAIVILLFCTFVYFVWYQQVYFNVSGVSVPLQLLFIVDVVLGPLLTFIVYKQGKKHLKLDMAMIVGFQLAAFLYGAYAVYLGKPSLVVHRTGYLEVIIEKNIDYGQLSDDMKRQNYWFFPVYGEIKSDELTPISSVSDYLGEMVLFDVGDRASFSRPLTLEQAKDTFKNAQAKTKAQFEEVAQEADDFIFYELKFETVFGVLIIQKRGLQLKAAMTP